MKRKIRFIIVACFIAGVAVTGFNMAQNNQNTGVSLADILMLAKAGGEAPCTDGICYRNWLDCLDGEGNTCPDSLVCDGGGGC